MTDGPEEKTALLIVDDTPEDIDLLKGILRDHYEIKAATRGGKALEIARGSRVDLVLLDVVMPEMNGYEVCRQLKEDERTRDIPVVFVTSLNEVTDETRGFEAGAVDFINKPVSASVVLARVRTHLALKEAQAQLKEWNTNLKRRLLQSVAIIREKSQELMSAGERSPTLRRYIQLVEIMSGVFELIGGRFGLHSRLVSEMAADAARKLKMDAESIAKIRLAGLMHDVGLIGHPSALGKNEDEMTTEEIEEMKIHPLQGQHVFQPLEELHDAGEIVRWHHEAYNGSGYPDGLKGEQIPLGARLVAIADVIEQAASAVRSEKAEYALAKARCMGGTLLDPHLIPHFQAIARIVYFEKNGSPKAVSEVEVPYAKLHPGLRLSRDLLGESGVMLIKKGTELDSASLNFIRLKNREGELVGNGLWVGLQSE